MKDSWLRFGKQTNSLIRFSKYSENFFMKVMKDVLQTAAGSYMDANKCEEPLIEFWLKNTEYKSWGRRKN